MIHGSPSPQLEAPAQKTSTSATRIRLTGLAADVCILFTAHDAHLRDYEIIVPSDCVASNTLPETRMALTNMKKAAHEVICKSAAVDFNRHAAGRRPAKAKAQNLTKKS